MKKNIHPPYNSTKVRCACGNEMEIMSTRGDISVEVCSKCHPFYTDKQRFVDTGGRIGKFKKRLAQAR